MGGARRPAAVVNGACEPPGDPLPFLEFLVAHRAQTGVNPLFFLFQREQVVARTIPDTLREHRKMGNLAPRHDNTTNFPPTFVTLTPVGRWGGRAVAAGSFFWPGRIAAEHNSEILNARPASASPKLTDPEFAKPEIAET